MLSTTHTLDRAKRAIGKPFSEFGYETELDFDAALAEYAEDIRFERMIDRIGEDAYAAIEGRDWNSLLYTEQAVVLAESLFIAAEFLDQRDTTESQERQGMRSESLTTRDYGRSVAGMSGLAHAASKLRGKAERHMTLAGYPKNLRLQRGDSIYS